MAAITYQDRWGCQLTHLEKHINELVVDGIPPCSLFGQCKFLNIEWMQHLDYQCVSLLVDQISGQMLNDNIINQISLLELDLWMIEKLAT